MLRIVVEGIEADYPSDISIPMKLQNPLFSQTAWNEGYSYSFSLLNTARTYAIFYGNNAAKKKFSVEIFFQGEIWIQGTLSEPKVNDKTISVNVVESAINLRQLLSETHFDDLQLDSYQIYDEADSIAVKLEKWRAYMYQVTIVDPVDQGSHKFPKIGTNSYNDGSGGSPLNSIHLFNLGMVNAWVLEDYVPNEAVPTSYVPIPGNTQQWYTTVSPCVRIDYLLHKVAEHFGIVIDENDLEQIPEYMQATHFSAFVLDNMVVSGLDKFNVHTESFDLSDFLTDAFMITLTEMLTGQFGAYYIQVGNRLTIRVKDTLINTKPVNMSKYATRPYTREKSQQSSFTLSYGLSEEELRDKRTFLYSEFTIQWPYIEPFADVEIIEDGGDVKPIEFPHVPLQSNYIPGAGLYRNFADFQSGQIEDQYGFTEFTSYLRYTDLIRSDAYPDENISKPTTFILGLVRGLYTTRNLVYDPFPTPGVPPEEAVDHLYSYNFKTQMVAPDTEAVFAPYKATFGNSSIYINEQDNSTAVYAEDLIKFLQNTRDVDKNMNIPAHILLELRKWKQPVHTIEQTNMSFQGIAKEISFNIGKRHISQSTITYAVKNNVPLNDMNDDFNNDFSV